MPHPCRKLEESDPRKMTIAEAQNKNEELVKASEAVMKEVDIKIEKLGNIVPVVWIYIPVLSLWVS